jgi:hypothetical protein
MVFLVFRFSLRESSGFVTFKSENEITPEIFFFNKSADKLTKLTGF